MKGNVKLQIATNIGAILEYYDFIIFAYMIPYISQIFFPSDENEYIAFIKTACIFVSANLAKIIAAAIIGPFTLKISRFSIMIYSIYIMTISTVLIGVLPDYKTIGVFAPILLFILRLLQGIAYSVEIPSNVVFIKEYYQEHQGLKIGCLLSSATAGSIMATLIMSVLSSFFSQDQIIEYIWRIPFILGGLLGFVGIYMRRINLSNTPNTNLIALNIGQILKMYNKKILEAITLLLLPASLIVIYIYMPSVISKYFDITISSIYLASSIGLVGSIITAIITGIAIDKRWYLYIKSIYILFFFFYPLIWYFLTYKSFLILVIFTISYQYFLTSFMVISLNKISSFVPSSIGGLLFICSYNLAFLICNFIPTVGAQLNMKISFIILPIILVLCHLKFIRGH
ncbi:MAG: MFS transporter [Rickettsia endosymbiont of Pseudomimeciton antennatum]|nr:MFS transporter [Rickettsia endosymbiont of Pseudomimeciton antennatum]